MSRPRAQSTSITNLAWMGLLPLAALTLACAPADQAPADRNRRLTQPSKVAEALPAPIEIEVPDPRFLNETNGTVGRWKFSSSRVEYDDQDWTATLLSGAEVGASLELDSSGQGVILDSSHPMTRIDLSSDSLALKPFTRYRVVVEYEFLDGPPLGFVCLHPDEDRTNLDLAFLPAHELGAGPRHAELELHSGRSARPYRLAVSLTGIGRLRVSSIRLVELGPFRIPDAPVLVVDLLSLEPDPANIDLWSNVKKFRDLYGFESIHTVHPLEVSTAALSRVAPALIVFSPTAVALDSQTLGFFEKRRFRKGIRKVLEYAENHDLPIMGVCAGHQSIAEANGALMARIRDDDTGEYLYELGPTELSVTVDDPLFAGLPRNDTFRIIEAHMILVHDEFQVPASLAATPEFPTQIFRYSSNDGDGPPWYTFQGHPEKDWEHACPEGSVLMANLMRIWGFHDDRESPVVETTGPESSREARQGPA